MAFVFVTGTTDGLGRAAAQSLLGDGYQVVLHTRSADRAATVGDLASRAAGMVVGDPRSAAETRAIADRSTQSAAWHIVTGKRVAFRSSLATRQPRDLAIDFLSP
ncbi:SDR family NAD(P)-dependent oxidoreductase [Bradyrhizobium sp. CB1015]|nr:SDR family NAD(P)-dependent oxidoreductase [Bradyrhizobium sp. CB1015]